MVERAGRSEAEAGLGVERRGSAAGRGAVRRAAAREQTAGCGAPGEPERPSPAAQVLKDGPGGPTSGNTPRLRRTAWPQAIAQRIASVSCAADGEPQAGRAARRRRGRRPRSGVASRGF